ncbi:MAG: L,D-transpeptidase family protein [Moraxellaceae bacterium]
MHRQSKMRVLLCLPLLLLFAGLLRAETQEDSIRTRLEPYVDSSASLRLVGSSLPQAVVQFYAENNWAPVWDDARLQVLLSELSLLYTDGLNPDDYGFSVLERALKQPDSMDAAERDMVATRGYLLALLHLYHGKVDPTQLDSHWNFDSRQLDPQVGLELARTAVASNTLHEIFEKARPTITQYHSLRMALARYRTIALNGGWPQIPAGKPLQPGMSDARVALLRQHFVAVGIMPYADLAQPDFYDDELKAAVARFQQESYLDVDGAVGPATLAVLNIPVRERINQIRANLERIRWFMNDTTDDYVIVDLAGYRIFYMKDGALKWQSRVQIGKEYRETPVFKSAISYITLSPGWVVPPTIFKEDSLPAIRRNPAYLSRNKLSIYNAAGEKIQASSVNWNRPGNITLRQDPGPEGSLGELVIRFANPYSIYLHDTPHKEMFAFSQRATSSGCIRVQNIHELAVLLFDDEQKWSREAMEKVIAERKTRNVTLKKKIPILLAYWTVDMGEDAYVSFKPDIYKKDAEVVKALSATP